MLFTIGYALKKPKRTGKITSWELHLWLRLEAYDQQNPAKLCINFALYIKLGVKEAIVKAHEWYERGNSSADPIDAFSNYWRAFNNLYSPGRKGQEREKIVAFLRGSITEERAALLLSANADCVNYLVSKPTVDMRGNGKDTGPNIAAYNSATTAFAKLEQLLLVVYQVRCNLEHGQKSPTRQRDVKLCKCSAPIVAALIKSDA
jgi:hypothetical protein